MHIFSFPDIAYQQLTVERASNTVIPPLRCSKTAYASLTESNADCPVFPGRIHKQRQRDLRVDISTLLKQTLYRDNGERDNNKDIVHYLP